MVTLLRETKVNVHRARAGSPFKNHNTENMALYRECGTNKLSDGHGGCGDRAIRLILIAFIHYVWLPGEQEDF